MKADALQHLKKWPALVPVLAAAAVVFDEKDRALSTLNSIGDAVICTDSAGNITYLNAAAEKLSGWTLQDSVDKPSSEVLHMLDAKTGQTITNPLAKAIGENATLDIPADTVLLRRDGTSVPIEDSVAPIHDRDGRVTGAVIVLRDVSVTRSLAQQHERMAQHDALTGLPNRLLLNDRIERAIALSRRHGRKFAVLFLDLDGFKHINDTLGHAAGDKLLQSVAERLVKCVREEDTVSRLGGDEFVVLLSEVEPIEKAANAARRILLSVTDFHMIDDRKLHITTSIGMSFYPDNGEDAEALIKNADTAMYQAKKNGRQSYQFFETSMDTVHQHPNQGAPGPRGRPEESPDTPAI